MAPVTLALASTTISSPSMRDWTSTPSWGYDCSGAGGCSKVPDVSLTALTVICTGPDWPATSYVCPTTGSAPTTERKTARGAWSYRGSRRISLDDSITAWQATALWAGTSTESPTD